MTGRLVSGSVAVATVGPRVPRTGRHRERRRADLAFVLEVQEQTVRSTAGGGGREGDVRAGPGPGVGVDVEVREVTGAQGHQVAVGAEVGLEIGDGAVGAGDLELELGRGVRGEAAGELDLVAVDDGGAARGRKLLGRVGARGGEVRAEDEVLGPFFAGVKSAKTR